MSVLLKVGWLVVAVVEGVRLRSVVFEPLDPPQLDPIVMAPVDAPPLVVEEAVVDPETSEAPKVTLEPVVVQSGGFPTQPDVQVNATPTLESIFQSLPQGATTSDELQDPKALDKLIG